MISILVIIAMQCFGTREVKVFNACKFASDLEPHVPLPITNIKAIEYRLCLCVNLLADSQETTEVGTRGLLLATVPG